VIGPPDVENRGRVADRSTEQGSNDCSPESGRDAASLIRN